jgi:8-oxo-dGTP pyrophosphatase MutT (NUDIX family)
VRGSDAVAAVIVLDDARYLLQHRDDVPGIWYPGYWGCFGGAVDQGEEPLETLRRELFEELELRVSDAVFLTRFDFDFSGIGLGQCYRIFYVVRLKEAEHNNLVLHEGQAMAAFPIERILNGLRVTPYDAFAVHLHQMQTNSRAFRWS